MSIFIQNGVTCEIVMLAVCIILLGFIYASKPKKTRMLKIVKAGFVASLFTIVLNMLLLVLSEELKPFIPAVFYFIYILFAMAYTIVLVLIFVYIDLLSYTRRSQEKQIAFMVTLFSVLYMIIMLLPMFMGKLIIIGPEKVTISHYYNAYVFCGIADAILCIIVLIINKKYVSHIVFRGGIVYLLCEIVLLIMQLLCDTAVFTSATYVLAFVIFYGLFHSMPFDEVIGCQGGDAFYVRVDDAISNHKRFITVTVIFPALQKRDFYDNKDVIDYCASYMCREVEMLRAGASIYCHNSYTYSLFCEESKSDTSEKLLRKISEVLSHPIFKDGVRVDARYKMIVIHDSPRYTDSSDIQSVIAYEKSRFLPNLDNEIINVDDEELSRVAEKDKIEQVLFDIRNRCDFNDERVVCYAQPIFCIETGTFKSAEALMRLNVNGEIVYPDKFISLAENNGSIHSLTLIMVDKVCKYIKSIEKTHEFDAITVNCSTVELDDRNLHRELADIMIRNDVDPSKIRLEITESLDVAKYDNILYNMEKLKEFGVVFYLDDFGTGYSNLERIVSYPFHTIKFDKNILYKALGSEKADTVLDSTVKLFRESGFNTVIEGVEDEKQSQYAKDKGFGYIQGYMYSKPIEIEGLKSFFQEIIIE